METLTKNQQSIIDAIVSEFNRINGISKIDNFNLINASELYSINDEINRYKEEAELDNKYWISVAMEEARRLAELLQQDLPMACVERFGKSNGKYDLPSVIIQRERGICGHHENYVSFDVIVIKESVTRPHNCGYSKGVRLAYSYWNSEYASTQYDSIEDLFSNSTIADEIRRKILR